MNVLGAFPAEEKTSDLRALCYNDIPFQGAFFKVSFSGELRQPLLGGGFRAKFPGIVGHVAERM
jgi:hypothetical protein